MGILRLRQTSKGSRRTLKQRGRSRQNQRHIQCALQHSLIESLELRRLLSTSVNLTGDAGSNSFYIVRNGTNVDFFKNEPTTSTPAITVPYADLGPVTLTGGGATAITLDYSGGDLLPNGLTFSGQSPAISPNQLTVLGNPNASYVLNSNTLAITTAANTTPFTDSISFTSLTSFNLTASGGTSTIEVASGSPYFNSDLGANSTSANTATTTTVEMTVDSGASVYFGSNQHLDALTINTGGFVQMLMSGEIVPGPQYGSYTGTYSTSARLLDTNTLTVNGILDLTDADMLVQDPSEDAVIMLQDQVAAGYNDGDTPTTQGTIISSSASTDNMALGIAPESDTGINTLDGENIAAGAVVARYTVPGDAYLEGGAFGDSLGLVSSNYARFNATGDSMPYWWQGDFYYDGYVGADNLGLEGSFYAQTNVTGIVGAQPTEITAGASFTIPLPATQPTIGTIIRYDINWGDGDFSSYPAALFSSASHTYTSPGMPEIQLTAVAASGSVYHPPSIPMQIDPTTAVTALNIAANSSSSAFTVSANASGYTIVSENGVAIESVATGSLLSLSITGDSAGLTTIHFSSGDPLPPSGLNIDSGQLNIVANSSSNTLVATTTAAIFGNSTIAEADINYPATTQVSFIGAGNNDQIDALTGTVTIAGDSSGTTGGPNVFVDTGATLLLNGTQHFCSLNILPGGTSRLLQNGSAVLDTHSLSISGADSYNNSGGVLDLADNSLIVHSGDLSAIAAYLKNGYDNMHWDGESTAAPTLPCILSSIAAADPTQTTALGFAQIGTSTSTGQLNLSSFDGVSVAASDVVVKFTLYGDANLDGTVDITDQNLLNSGYTNHLTGWANGDFTYSGSGVDGSDFTLFSNIYVPAPVSLAATVASPTQINLTWTDSAATGSNDVVYESTDSGVTYQPVYQVAMPSDASTNTYTVSGLAPASQYKFYVVTAGIYEVSAASNTTLLTATPFVAPTLSIQGSDTVVEGQPYVVNLTAAFPDGEAGSITQWSVDWNDGPGGTSDVVTYGYAAGADTTQPLAVSHMFASGIATPTISVTATDGINGTFPAVTQPVAVIPVGPAMLNRVVTSSSEIDLSWTTPSNISTGSILFESTDGVNYNPLYEVASGINSYQVAGLISDTQYWFEVETDSLNGQSDPATAAAATTDYVQPQLAVTQVGQLTEGGTLSLSLAWNAVAGMPASDAITNWQINWGFGPTQLFGAGPSGTVLSESSPSLPSTTASLQVSVIAVANDNPSASYHGPFTALNETVAVVPIAPTSITASYGSGGTSVGINWSDSSQLATTYLVQRELPGTAWATVQSVSAGSSANYSWTDTGLVAGSGGSGGGYLYRVIAKGPQVTGLTSTALSVPISSIVPAQPSRFDGSHIFVGTSNPYCSSSGSFQLLTGGVGELPVTVTDSTGNPQSGVDLTVITYDAGIMTPFETTVTTDSNGLAYIPIQGIAAGTTPIVVTDGSGDEGSTTITTTIPSTAADSEYQVSLPTTGFVAADGGTDDIVSNLSVTSPDVMASSPQSAILQGISGTITDVTTGQTIAFPDPSHVAVEPSTNGGSPTITITLTAWAPTVITTIEDGNPPPVTSTTLTTIVDVVPENLISLTVTDAHVATSTQTATTTNPKMDLYVGEQQDGTVTVNLQAQETTRAADEAVSWTIAGSSASPSSGNFGKAPQIILTPGVVDYVLKAMYLTTTLEIDIHVLDLTVATESIQNTPGAPLAKPFQQTIGAYVPLDNVHEDYDTPALSNIADYKLPLQPGYAASPMSVPDDELVKITLNGPGAGIEPFKLEIPANVTIWKNQNLTEQVNNTTPLDPGSYWVEGIQPGLGWIYADWSGGGQSVYHADALKVTTFNWSGPQDVPQYGTFLYTASAPGLWETPDHGRLMGTGITGVLSNIFKNTISSIQWNSGPTVGDATYLVNQNWQWEIHVNIVQITLAQPSAQINANAPAGPNVFFAPGTVVDAMPAQRPTDTHGLTRQVSKDVGPGLKWGANITLTGPNGGHGVSDIKVGFIQNVIDFESVGTYNSGRLLASSIDGTISPTRPMLDQATGAPGQAPIDGPWYADLNTMLISNLMPNSATGAISSDIVSSDEPGDGPPVWYNQDLAFKPGEDVLKSFEVKFLFDLYICGTTVDQQTLSQNVYTKVADARWGFDAKSTATSKYAFPAFPQQNNMTTPGQWTLYTGQGPSVPGTTQQPIFNVVQQSATFT